MVCFVDGKLSQRKKVFPFVLAGVDVMTQHALFLTKAGPKPQICVLRCLRIEEETLEMDITIVGVGRTASLIIGSDLPAM